MRRNIFEKQGVSFFVTILPQILGINSYYKSTNIIQKIQLSKDEVLTNTYQRKLQTGKNRRLAIIEVIICIASIRINVRNLNYILNFIIR